MHVEYGMPREVDGGAAGGTPGEEAASRMTREQIKNGVALVCAGWGVFAVMGLSLWGLVQFGPVGFHVGIALIVSAFWFYFGSRPKP